MKKLLVISLILVVPIFLSASEVPLKSSPRKIKKEELYISPKKASERKAQNSSPNSSPRDGLNHLLPLVEQVKLVGGCVLVMDPQR